MKADRSHSAIWMLVDKGLNPGLELFASGAKEEIENAKAPARGNRRAMPR